MGSVVMKEGATIAIITHDGDASSILENAGETSRLRNRSHPIKRVEYVANTMPAMTSNS